MSPLGREQLMAEEGDVHRELRQQANGISAQLHNCGMRRLINYAVSDARCSAG
jgi:hypothetical protein